MLTKRVRKKYISLVLSKEIVKKVLLAILKTESIYRLRILSWEKFYFVVFFYNKLCVLVIKKNVSALKLFVHFNVSKNCLYILI